MKTWDYASSGGGKKETGCCNLDSFNDARQAAVEHGFPHYVLDYESRFKDSVIEEFADAYARGETPIPCVRCNQTVKFKDLLATARDLGADALATGLPVHVDATQAAGRVELDLAAAHGVVISGHKLGGPPGIGVLSLPGSEAFPTLLTGGTQERGRRAGTVNLPGAVGLGVACAVARRERSTRRARWARLRVALESGLEALGARVVGAEAPRVPQTTCAVLPVGPSELVVQALDLRGIAVSAGAACASGSQEPSPVLTAMGDVHPDRSLRVSLGPESTRADVDALLGALAEVLPALADLE